MNLSSPSFAAGKPYFYIVKKSDIASSILQRGGLKPIYEKNGFLQRLQKVNPEIEDLDMIFPGQRIAFTEKLVKKGKSLGLIGVSAKNEIYFIKRKLTIQPKQKAKKSESATSPSVPPPQSISPPLVPPPLLPTQSVPPKSDLKKPDAMIQKPKKTKTKLESSFAINVTLGSGFSFLSFAQNGSETRNLEYSSFTGPSFSIRAGADWQSGFGVDISYANYPGELKSSTNNITNSRFNWTAQSLEATYRVNNNIKSKGHYHLRAGVQHHDLPYVQLPTVSTADVKKHEVTMATLGVNYNFEFSKKWHHQILLRYQIPISQSKSVDDIQFQSRFAFDGSLGASYNFSSRYNIGLFWYGQWQEFNYSMLNIATNQKDTGQNRFFFSNLEFRIGYIF